MLLRRSNPRWRASRAGGSKSLDSMAARLTIADGARAAGALAAGAIALGALALGALAIGRLAIGQARIRKLEIDELVVRRLRVSETLDAPDASRSQNGGTV